MTAKNQEFDCLYIYFCADQKVV